MAEFPLDPMMAKAILAAEKYQVRGAPPGPPAAPRRRGAPLRELQPFRCQPPTFVHVRPWSAASSPGPGVVRRSVCQAGAGPSGIEGAGGRGRGR